MVEVMEEDCSGFVFFEDLHWQLLLGLLDNFRLCWYFANLWLFDLPERQVNLASWPFPSTAAMHLILVVARCCHLAVLFGFASWLWGWSRKLWFGSVVLSGYPEKTLISWSLQQYQIIISLFHAHHYNMLTSQWCFLGVWQRQFQSCQVNYLARQAMRSETAISQPSLH